MNFPLRLFSGHATKPHREKKSLHAFYNMGPATCVNPQVVEIVNV